MEVVAVAEAHGTGRLHWGVLRTSALDEGRAPQPVATMSPAESVGVQSNGCELIGSHRCATADPSFTRSLGCRITRSPAARPDRTSATCAFLWPIFTTVVRARPPFTA